MQGWETSLIVFGEIFLTLPSSKSRKSYDINMKIYESPSAILIKYNYSQVMNIFVEVLNKKLWVKSFFVLKPKKDLFGESWTCLFRY